MRAPYTWVRSPTCTPSRPPDHQLCARRSLYYITRARSLHVGIPAHVGTVYGRLIRNLRARAGRYTTYLTWKRWGKLSSLYTIHSWRAAYHVGVVVATRASKERVPYPYLPVCNCLEYYSWCSTFSFELFSPCYMVVLLLPVLEIY